MKYIYDFVIQMGLKKHVWTETDSNHDRVYSKGDCNMTREVPTGNCGSLIASAIELSGANGRES